MDLRGKTAVVTGSATGIGAACAILLAKRGANVVVNYSKSQSEAEATLAAIEAEGVRGLLVRADCANEAEVAAMMQQAAGTFGGIDVLVNNAARTYFVHWSKIFEVTDEMWRNIFDLNVRGAFLCSREASRYMGNPSHIVSIGSIAGLTGEGSSIPYAASKAALHSVTKSLARALAPATRVNCVAPGYVDTRWSAGFGDVDALRADEVAVSPLKHATQPEDVAAGVLGLIEGGDLVTGQTLLLDGGRSLVGG